MNLIYASFLLFSLNLLDALLTIIWVRNGVATEGNPLMAKLLEMGDFTFLAAKLAMGTFAAFVFLRWGENRKLAKYGISVVLAVYICLMGVHFATGLSAFGFVSDSIFSELSRSGQSFLAYLN